LTGRDSTRRAIAAPTPLSAAAEIDDHLNQGRNMDTRTPQEHCAFVV
jgi:hypothetical protein